MAIDFTSEQEKVIKLRNRNILVSAAAGSGKTAVLVERIVRMVCDEEHPVDIDRLLIVTFTNAAAAEMRERIDMGIAEQLRLHPESEHIQRQSTLLHNAQITTIHSFCLFLIRNHFHETSLDPELGEGLDPAFRVADENEMKLLKQDVLAELLEEQFAAEDEAFTNCVEFFCPGGRESVLEKDIMDLLEEALSNTFPVDWLEARRQDYAPDSQGNILHGPAEEYLLHYLRAVITGCVQKLEAVKVVCEQPDGPHMYGDTVEAEKEMLEKLLVCGHMEDYAAKVPAVAFGRLSGKKDPSVDPAKRELAQELRNEVKERMKKLSEEFFRTSVPTIKKRAVACDRAIRVLIDLTLAFYHRLQEKKAEKKIIDFSDMEHLALNILLEKTEEGIRPSKVAEEYRQFFHEILIDEYQDSNLAQEALLGAISGEEAGHHNRFMVGDVKQSIYGFRQARPELFLEKYETYEQDGDPLCRIDLSKNYRSRTQVVDTVNSVFARIMSRETGGIVYDEAAQLNAQAAYPESAGNESEFLLIEKPEKGGELNEKQAEAKAVAVRIKELRRDLRVYDKDQKTMRPVRYADMVILLRTNAGWDEEFKKVLEAEGIPVYVTSKTGYFAAREVQELLQTLRVLDNPRQDIPLYGMMKSVFGGFTEEEIVRLRTQAGSDGKKKGSLYEALCSVAEKSLGEAAYAKAAAFLEKINRYRSYTVYLPIRDLLQKLVEEHDYLNYVTALPAGSRRRANVEMLFTKASDFEKTSYFGLFHFVRYMEQLEKYEVDYGEADTLDENADVVRIMSIHKSKGLEFPVTFVCGLGKQFNEQDARKALIVDADMGLGVTFVDPKHRIRCKTLRQNVIGKKMVEDMLAEELRVLYVALTRAREKLILTGVAKEAAQLWERISADAANRPGVYSAEQLAYLEFVTAKGYLDFLLPVLPYTDFQVKVLGKEELGEKTIREQVDLEVRRMALTQLEINDADSVAGIASVTGPKGANGAAAKAQNELWERLSYSYPHKNLEKLYTKTTVSELKAEAMAEQDEAAHDLFEGREKEPYVPKFIAQEKTISGTLRGSAFHRAMEILDLDSLLGEWFPEFPADYTQYLAGMQKNRAKLKKKIEVFLQEQTETLRLSVEYYEAVNPWKVVAFLQLESAYRMWRAERSHDLYREQPFVLGIDAKELSGRFEGDAPEGEILLIQGIIDVFWVESDGIVLLDYKTDKVDNTDALWDRYETQMNYYSRALTQITGRPVKERILYSSRLEQEAGRL
ncbi:MAG: helicase-exonuclease AddAB subunit AddA [Lachnospiraceae bacterium]|nr:helicase-exonuclease AddAB subunit AddA [Lachnospiraceae bacterium]